MPERALVKPREPVMAQWATCEKKILMGGLRLSGIGQGHRPRPNTMNTDAGSLRSALDGLSLPGTGKFQIAKALVSLSETAPEAIDPFFDVFAGLLDDGNNIIKWTAFQIIANLAAVDRQGRIDAIIDRYLAPIAGPVMITAGHAIQGSARIAATHKHLTDRIVRAILGTEHARYKTDECRNIALGHAIKALGCDE